MSSAWLLLAFVFVLGTIVGSFLNVVIYRLPAGKNIVYPGSSCPACGHAIRWYDNVPILGWLWLGGRCRDCGAAIARRYPIVEATVGLLFVVLAATDILIPYLAAQEAAGDRVPVASDMFLLRYAYHLILLCALFAAAMIDSDGHRLPRRLITWPCSAGILLGMFWPMLQMFPLQVSHGTTTTGMAINGLLTALLGMLTAVVFRIAAISWLGAIRLRELRLSGATLALYAVGAFLGWQTVLAAGLLAVAWALATHMPRTPPKLTRVGALWIVFAAALVWCLVEQQIAALF